MSITDEHAARQRAFGIPSPGFRLPDDTHVGPVSLQVRDLRRSIDYYEQVIGLSVQTTTTDSAVLGSHGDAMPLVRLHSRAGVTSVPGRGAFGLYHFAILLPDRASLGRFAAHLSRLDLRVGSADHQVSEALYLWDSDGLGIEVYADRPRSAWARQGRELVMTTDPLDLSGLAAAAGGRPWDGVPAGTTMGHVHLQVGSLDGAEAFYHLALGFDKTVWNYPGALFLSAGGYHHHLGTNTWSARRSAGADTARLLEWELVVSSNTDVSDAARSLRAAGYAADETAEGCTTADPWGTRLRIVAS